jgi:nucleoside-diphosphate-sugar epimerase
MIDKKIVIAGGTGFIGRNVADYFETTMRLSSSPEI